MSPPKVAIIIYTVYGHIGKMAEAVKAGIISAGGTAEIFQVPETLPSEVLEKMKAPPKPNYRIATLETLESHDGFVFGVPTRFGMMPAQWKAFWDTTSSLWTGGKLTDKYAAFFVSSSTPTGGQETTVLTALSPLVHHGINFVPFGYSRAYDELLEFKRVRGGSAWGAGTYAGVDGSLSPNDLEIAMAEKQGHAFWKTVSRVNF